MKVTRNTADHLIVADIPWMIGIGLTVFTLIFVGMGLFLVFEGEPWGLLFAAFGGGIGLLFFAIFVRRTQLILDRAENRITLRTRSVFGFEEATYPLENLDHAMLERTTNSKGQTSQRPTLVMKGRADEHRVPIVSVYTNMRGPERTVSAINEWLIGG